MRSRPYIFDDKLTLTLTPSQTGRGLKHARPSLHTLPQYEYECTHLVYTRESHIGHSNLSTRASLRIAEIYIWRLSEYTWATRSVSEIIHAQLTLAKERPANAERNRQIKEIAARHIYTHVCDYIYIHTHTHIYIYILYMCVYIYMETCVVCDMCEKEERRQNRAIGHFQTRSRLDPMS